MNAGRMKTAGCMRAAPSVRPVDRDVMMARLGGDEELFAEATVIFLEDCPGRLANIRTALDAGDPTAIRAAAHALKGAAGLLAANELFEAARTIENLSDEGRIYDARAAWPRLSDAAAAVMDEFRRFDDSRPKN